MQVDFKIEARIGHGSGDRDLGGEMIDIGGVRHGPLHLLRVAHIAHRDLQPSGASGGLLEPVQVVVHPGAGEVIEDVHLRAGPVKQVVRQV